MLYEVITVQDLEVEGGGRRDSGEDAPVQVAGPLAPAEHEQRAAGAVRDARARGLPHRLHLSAALDRAGPAP